jgi:hypothetical protein
MKRSSRLEFGGADGEGPALGQAGGWPGGLPVAGRGGGVVAGKFGQVGVGGVEPVVAREPGVGLLRIPDVAQV